MLDEYERELIKEIVGELDRITDDQHTERIRCICAILLNQGKKEEIKDDKPLL